MLNPKQLAFCREYVKDHNATKAAERAGYAAGSAHVTASRLLSDAKVAVEVARLESKVTERAEITAEYVLRGIQGIVERTSIDNPNAALKGHELLGRHLALFTDKTEHSGTLVVDVEQRLSQARRRALEGE